MGPPRSPAPATYSSSVPLLPPALVAAVLVLALLALVPTRRLFQRGASGVAVAGYFISLWLLGLVILAAPGRARILLPVLLVVGIAPYFHIREGIDRLLGRPPRPPRPPIKNVTPPDEQ